MTTGHAPQCRAPQQSAPASSPSGLHGALDRLDRQLGAIDLWARARRQRERELRDRPLSRDQRMDVDRQIEVLRRVHDTVKGRCAVGLATALDPFLARTTVVIAHRHPWFRDRLATVLSDRGCKVLVATGDGAEALGVAVAEQPDLLLAGENLAMMTGRGLLAEARQFAAGTVRVLQVADLVAADREDVVDGLLPDRHSPEVVADTLLGLHRSRTTLPTA